MTGQDPAAPEFSRPVAADRVGRDGYDVTIEADPAERQALARRFGLVALDRLLARCRLRPVAGGMIELKARFQATVVQDCVVSLEPFAAEIEEEFAQRYALDPTVLRGVVEDEEIDLAADDPPEAMQDGAVDLGEAVAQQLAIAIDPFPRAPGVGFEGGEAGEDGAASPGPSTGLSTGKSTGVEKVGEKPETATRPNPFAVLSKLKK